MSSVFAPVRCEYCKHFAALQNQCRFNPPGASVVTTKHGETGFMQVFPPVNKSDWCGKFERDSRTEKES